MLLKLHEKLSFNGKRDSRSRFWNVIDTMYANCKSRVVIEGQESPEYTVNLGFSREGSVLSPILYAIFIDDIVRTFDDNEGGFIGSVKMTVLLYDCR